MTPLRDDDRRTLSAVLGELLPASDDGRMPAAGELGLAAFVEQGAAPGSELARALPALLASLGARGFAGLERAARVALLKELEQASPSAFRALLAVAYGGYYQHPRVVEALGLEARPPFPKGYAVPPSDFGLLDAVRRRPSFYREC
jgi:hypothetical protein